MALTYKPIKNKNIYSFDNNKESVQQTLVKNTKPEATQSSIPTASGMSVYDQAANQAAKLKNSEYNIQAFEPQAAQNIIENNQFNKAKELQQDQTIKTIGGAALTGAGKLIAKQAAKQAAQKSAELALTAATEGGANAAAQAAGSAGASSALGTVASAVPIIGAVLGANQILHMAGDQIKTNEYGEAKNNTLGGAKELSRILDYRNIGKGIEAGNTNGEKVLKGITGALGINSGLKAYSAFAGKTQATTGAWGAINKYTGQTKKNKKVEEEKAAEAEAADKAAKEEKARVDAENARIAEERRVTIGHGLENARLQSIMNSVNSKSLAPVYSAKKGTKLVPIFRRGGELDIHKENIILDGPSHDEHNKTGVKGDKGMPIVKDGVKIAEIESLELILNKNTSKKLEEMVSKYKETKDPTLLKSIGDIMQKELKENTYDYSKELIK